MYCEQVRKKPQKCFNVITHIGDKTFILNTMVKSGHSS